VEGDQQPSAGEVMRDLHRRDLSAAEFGIEFIETEADRVSVRMTVTEEMCNGFIIGHGGMTFLLADSAMAFLSNGANDSALATTATIHWLKPTYPGDVLTATGTTRWQQGRIGIHDVVVTNQNGDEVAHFQGRTQRTGRPVMETPSD
jgi:acyl-CoA thioesterase